MRKFIRLAQALMVAGSAFMSGQALADDCASITSYGAVPNSVSYGEANTVAINNALQANPCVFVPRGVFWISVSAGGIVVRPQSTLRGTGPGTSMLIAKDRSSGGMIRRAPPVGRGDYVDGVTIRDLGLVLNSAPYNAANPVMIGIDFRNVSGSLISDVYVGNTPYGVATAATAGWVTAKSDLAQGIGILLCTLSSGEGTLYSGGERNVVERARVWGARIGISIDDATLCPGSAAHATVVADSEIGTVEKGIAQQSRYGAGLDLRSNVIQDLLASGGVGGTQVMAYLMSGYAGRLSNRYIEVGSSPNPTFSLYLGDDSRGNDVELGYVGTALQLPQAVRIGGQQNRVRGYDNVTGTWYSVP